MKNFEKFFAKIWNFIYVSTPILLRWKKWSQQKILFECSFIAQNPFQTILGLWKTLKNFRKFFWIILFVSTPIQHRWKKWSQQKITFECSFIEQNPFQTILGLWKTLKIFRKKFWNFWKFLGFWCLISDFYVFTKKI